MKKIVILFLLLLTNKNFSQKIAQNKVDEFTKSTIIKSEWEKFSFTDYGSYINLNKVDDMYILGIKFITLKMCSVGENDKISFLFEDASSLDLVNYKYTISNYGDGAVGISGSQALGINLKLSISKENLETFRTKKISKIRIYTSQGYFEDTIKQKNREVVLKMFSLF